MSKTSDNTTVIVTPFTVEVDHPRNCDVVVQAIPGCRLRSAIAAAKPVRDQKTGDEMIPQDQSRHLGQLPPIPGMRLSINPAERTYEITDPLRGNEELCEKIRRAMERSSAFKTGNKLDGVPAKKGELDVHRMKTLCREVLHMIENKHAKVVKGVKPDLEDIDEMPGKYLLNPGSRVQNQQPTYEEDFPAWCDRLTRSGG